MPVPALITALSTTAGSNSPGGSESTITVDDYIRALSAFIAQLRDGGVFTTLSPTVALRAAGATQGVVGTRAFGGSGTTANVGYDDVVIDSASASGLSILSGAANIGAVVFGDTAASTRGVLSYDHATDQMIFSVAATEVMRIFSNQRVSIGRSTDGGSPFLVDRLGSGTVPSLTAGNVAAFVGCAAAASPSYVSVVSGNTGKAGLFFADTDADGRGRVEYDHATETMTLATEGVSRVTVNSGQILATVMIEAPFMRANAQQFGYAVGAGGTVTQATSKSTAVTLNKPAGRITMHPANLSAGAVVSFTLNCSPLNQFTLVAVNIRSGAATGGSYAVSVDNIDVGTCRVNVQNLTAGTLGEALVLSFALIEGSDS